MGWLSALRLTGACGLVAAGLVSCPRIGDPHIETGFRVGPLSEKTGQALMRVMCGTDSPVSLPRGSYLWGGTQPALDGECTDLAVCRVAWNQSVLVRKVRCNQHLYVSAFYAGLQVTFKPQRAAVCKELADAFDRIPFSTSAEKATLQWWSRGPKGNLVAGLGCGGR